MAVIRAVCAGAAGRPVGKFRLSGAALLEYPFPIGVDASRNGCILDSRRPLVRDTVTCRASRWTPPQQTPALPFLDGRGLRGSVMPPDAILTAAQQGVLRWGSGISNGAPAGPDKNADTLLKCGKRKADDGTILWGGPAPRSLSLAVRPCCRRGTYHLRERLRQPGTAGGLAGADCAIYNSAEMTLEQVITVMQKAAHKTTVRLHTVTPRLQGHPGQMDAGNPLWASPRRAFPFLRRRANAEYRLPGVSRPLSSPGWRAAPRCRRANGWPRWPRTVPRW